MHPILPVPGQFVERCACKPGPKSASRAQHATGKKSIISASGATRMCIFAMESYGGLHKSSEALLQYLADSKYPGVGPGGSGDTDGLRARFIGTSRQRVSVACMKGNSTILQRFRKVCLRLTPAVPVV